MRRLTWMCLLAGCPAPAPDDPTPTGDVVLLPPEGQATRISMALRGTRPSEAELERVAADPEALDALVDAWMESDRFRDTVRHLHADTLLTRTPLMNLPPLGPLEGEDVVDIAASLTEEPLALAEDIVMSDQPYTALVTANYTMTNAINAEVFAGVGHDGGEGWSRGAFRDGRPAAGVLSTNALWLRYPSNGQNYHRARANSVADALLCSDFLGRDIPISGDVDLSDDEAVADALNNQPECVACHQSLDPLASHFWAYRSRVNAAQVVQGYATDCQRDVTCYPLPIYTPQLANSWMRAGVRGPGFYGQPSEDTGTLGQQIADDPRFAQCAVRRFVGYFAQQSPVDVPLSTVAPLQRRFVDSNFDARDLIAAIVTSDAFLAAEGQPDDGEPVGLLAARPLQLAATIEDLTGFRYVINIDARNCADRGRCIGDIDTVMDDAFGFRAMAGGIDGYRVTRPTHTTTPTKALLLAALAEEGAHQVVESDLAISDRSQRRLLTEIDASTTDEASVRGQLVRLHRRLYGVSIAADDPQIDEAWTLFEGALERRGSGQTAVAGAWKLTLTGLLQDPRLLLY